MDSEVSSSTLGSSNIFVDSADGESDTGSEHEPRSKRSKIDRTARRRQRSLTTSGSQSPAGSGRFKNWKLEYIEASTKGNKYTHCRLCHRDFFVTHSGHNDAVGHCASSGHQKKCGELQSASTITIFFVESNTSYASKVISAEVMMAQFNALHNLPF